MAASPENGRSRGRSRPVLLDTDIGSDVDDALALALLLALRDELDLVAVTTVTGDTALRARIASRLLAAAGRPEVEVCAGESLPLAGGLFPGSGTNPVAWSTASMPASSTSRRRSESCGPPGRWTASSSSSSGR